MQSSNHNDNQDNNKWNKGQDVYKPSHSKRVNHGIVERLTFHRCTTKQRNYAGRYENSKINAYPL